MKRNTEILIWVNCFFITSLLISNVVSSKVVFLFGLTIPAAVIAYPWTFLCTDIIGEIWGREEANRAVKRGIVVQLFSLALIFGAIYLPIVPFATDFQTSFQQTLGSSGRFVFASLLAYVVAQTNDVFIFHKLKELCHGENKWLRNNISTMISQGLDTAIFITIGFYGIVPNLLVMVVNQYIVKFIIALVDTPFFYFFTREEKI